MEETMPLVEEIYEFFYREETLFIKFFGKSDCQYSNASDKTYNIPFENVFKNINLLTETLIE